AVELVEHRLLRVDDLDDRLDHQVAVRELGERCRAAKPPARRLRILLGRLPRLHHARERAVDALETAVDELLVHLTRQHVEAGHRTQLRDPRTHLAEADDADLLNGHTGVDPPADVGRAYGGAAV